MVLYPIIIPRALEFVLHDILYNLKENTHAYLDYKKPHQVHNMDCVTVSNDFIGNPLKPLENIK